MIENAQGIDATHLVMMENAQEIIVIDVITDSVADGRIAATLVICMAGLTPVTVLTLMDTIHIPTDITMQPILVADIDIFKY